MKEEGPVPPLLLTGNPGLGKSTLLAKWYAERLYRVSSLLSALFLLSSRIRTLYFDETHVCVLNHS